MRILHFADLHLGVETYGYIDPTTGLSSRLNDFLYALDQVVDYALNNHVHLVLFCGDAYKNREPTQTYQREFAKRVKRLSANGIPLFLIVGNHDQPYAMGRATAVEIFETLSIANVTVAGRPGSYCLNIGKESLQIIALPWLRRGALLTREEYKNLTVEEINERIQAILTGWLNAEVEKIDTGIPVILAGHLAHSGAMHGSELTMLMGRDYIMLQSAISNPAFDYIALGHIHRRQVVECPMPLVYPGSLQTIDFGDEGEDKGFYIVEIDAAADRGKRLKQYEFHSVKTRRFISITIDADVENPTKEILQAIGRNEISGAIVRLSVHLPAGKQGLIQENEIRKALKDAYFIAAIEKAIKDERRYRIDTSAEMLTPMEALKLYFKARKIPEERMNLLIEYGAKLIQQSSESDLIF